jgi:hypothetical protein
MERTFNDLTDDQKKRAEQALDKLQKMKHPDLTKEDIELVKLLFQHLEAQPQAQPETQQDENEKKAKPKLEEEADESPAGRINLSCIMSKDHLSTLYNFLNNNGESQVTTLTNIYRATRDGEANFHAFCDNKGPTVVIISANGHVFGGYISIEWDSSGAFKTDTKAFVFSLTKPKKYPVWQATNYWAIYAVTGTLTFYFGYPGDIIIKNPFLNDFTNSCKVGPCYRSSQTEDNEFLAGSETFKVDEMEVFQVHH